MLLVVQTVGRSTEWGNIEGIAIFAAQAEKLWKRGHFFLIWTG